MENNNKPKSSKFVKMLRKWSRILHRDIGFFFVGASIIYGLSGIAVNHLKDWNPNYSVDVRFFSTELEFNKDNAVEQIDVLLNNLKVDEKYKTHYFPDKNTLKAYLTSSSTVEVDLSTGDGRIEILKRRPIFYHVNFLHFNPNKWWTWFSDAFAGSLILFALTSLFMVRGKKGAWGRGAIYIIAGIIIPLLILFLT
ncbi:MAG: PepSY-associated TM helix domain-containing protein [Bacteroidales bacterium]|nr:PepSY-associated TM helix domain-containing protein [Bacteroidales bacterium]